MSNTNFPYAVVSVFLIVVCIALAYFMLLPQYEKMFAQEYEISALEQKVETMQTYYEEIRKSYEELENIGWDIAEQKISANFMEGPFFKYNMQTYLEGLVTRSGLYLNSVSIEGVSDTYEFKKGEQSGEDRTREIGISFDVTGSYDFFRSFLELLDRQALVIKISDIDISKASDEGVPQLNFKIKASIPAK
ncbi:MAG: hypothetical protein PHO04_02745 [Candidatus Pacebacteria bacterium]|jgi:Tfp pilus assembly protein PilO|nr:hypothetical protein [Candidatus Paceibacterota bacterium]MDD2796879.1 hypothetical protein [Candidatus Paceibacterota bacterium]MDD3048171.1 hypothetical protein [Candidatus Paceibacterota bacterium]MDD3510208.1 hypothetical protein [Candidatus Paceibacterota bacterium]MDD3918879.1 hypothetical protein [Candidatus Paceibacterota bacterium]